MLIFSSILLGKVLPLMLEYGMMPLIMILWCQKVNIILQMQVILLEISCWFHIEVYAVRWKNWFKK